ncbi:MAG: hypothetical protein NTW96_03195 [Planctomycetia bacterium]|nr:hypothetical protein [Planctomycetia bacterium]
MSRRVAMLAVVAAMWVIVPPLHAEDPASNHLERPAQTQSRTEDNDRNEKQPEQNDPNQAAPTQMDPEETNWTFDRGLYTNNPTTGARVWQYAKKKPAYRDPYSFFDSPHEAYPFAPDPFYGPNYFAPYPYYGGYPYSRPYPYGPMPYVPSAQ